MLLKRFYWLLPLVIIGFQSIYTFSSMNQIRMEEVIEAFRSPWFFENRLVWSGSYSSIGWAFLQSLAYQLFGFHFFLGKLIKLLIELIAFFCLAAVLKKYLSLKSAWLPLLVIGLSPTLTYLNMLSMSHGTDVSFFLILLFILSTINFKKKQEAVFKQVLFWSLAMFAWLGYSGFAFYLQILGLIYLYIFFTQNNKIRFNFIAKNWTISLISFLIPLAFFFLFIQNRSVLVDDPRSHKGLFRSWATFEYNSTLIQDNLRRLYFDLFVNRSSYYFEVKKVEFSDFYPVISIIFITIISIIIFIKKSHLRPQISFLAFFFLLYLLEICLVGPKTLGGIRRGTILLVIFYGFAILAWHYFINLKNLNLLLKYLGSLSFILLLIHHLAVYPQNLDFLKNRSSYREIWWFNSDTKPDKILEDLVNQVQKTDLVLPCLGQDKENGYCSGLSLIYPAIALECNHNHLKCHNIYTPDPRFKGLTKLDISYWGEQTHVEP